MRQPTGSTPVPAAGIAVPCFQNREVTGDLNCMLDSTMGNPSPRLRCPVGMGSNDATFQEREKLAMVIWCTMEELNKRVGTPPSPQVIKRNTLIEV
jgi:hypothetical protein